MLYPLERNKLEKYKESHKLSMQKYREIHKDKIKAQNREYRNNHKLEILAWQKQNYSINKDVKKYGRIKRVYGLSREEYNNLFIIQDNKCAICKSTKKLYVDHNHNTNEVRGLLCHNCNSSIGYLKENVEVLKNAIEYLNSKRMK